MKCQEARPLERNDALLDGWTQVVDQLFHIVGSESYDSNNSKTLLKSFDWKLRAVITLTKREKPLIMRLIWTFHSLKLSKKLSSNMFIIVENNRRDATVHSRVRENCSRICELDVTLALTWTAQLRKQLFWPGPLRSPLVSVSWCIWADDEVK